MPYTKRYQTAAPVLANYDWADVAAGTGIITYYGASMLDNTTETFILTRNSSVQSNYVATGSMTEGLPSLDKDFDLTFTEQKRIKGRVKVGITLGIYCNSSTSTNAGTLYATVHMERVRAGTPTALGDFQTQTLTITDGQLSQLDTYSKQMAGEIDIATSQTFQKDDILRFTIKIYMDTTNNRLLGGFAHSPHGDKDSATENNIAISSGIAIKLIQDADNTQLTFQIPYLLGLR